MIKLCDRELLIHRLFFLIERVPGLKNCFSGTGFSKPILSKFLTICHQKQWNSAQIFKNCHHSNGSPPLFNQFPREIGAQLRL